MTWSIEIVCEMERLRSNSNRLLAGSQFDSAWPELGSPQFWRKKWKYQKDGLRVFCEFIFVICCRSNNCVISKASRFGCLYKPTATPKYQVKFLDPHRRTFQRNPCSFQPDLLLYSMSDRFYLLRLQYRSFYHILLGTPPSSHWALPSSGTTVLRPILPYPMPLPYPYLVLPHRIVDSLDGRQMRVVVVVLRAPEGCRVWTERDTGETCKEECVELSQRGKIVTIS